MRFVLRQVVRLVGRSQSRDGLGAGQTVVLDLPAPCGPAHVDALALAVGHADRVDDRYAGVLQAQHRHGETQQVLGLARKLGRVHQHRGGVRRQKPSGHEIAQRRRRLRGKRAHALAHRFHSGPFVLAHCASPWVARQTHHGPCGAMHAPARGGFTDGAASKRHTGVRVCGPVGRTKFGWAGGPGGPLPAVRRHP